MTHKKTDTQILVLGGTGKTGSRVVHRLTQLGYAVRIGSRSTSIPFDWENPATWPAVLQGMEAVYIAFQPDLAVPGAVETIRTLATLAVESGVQKLVLLSGRGEPEAQRCEQSIMDSGLDWTIVRASWFCQNFDEGYLLEPILSGHVALPAGNAAEPFIDADDIAEVAVAALTQNGHAGQIYEVTGPRLLTFPEAIAEIAAAAGRTITYESIPAEDYATMLSSYGLPPGLIGLIMYLFTEVLDGRNAQLADGVQRALGRTPTDFSDYVRKTAATGVWQQVLKVSDQLR